MLLIAQFVIPAKAWIQYCMLINGLPDHRFAGMTLEEQGVHGQFRVELKRIPSLRLFRSRVAASYSKWRMR
jgi:hypothetical protein